MDPSEFESERYELKELLGEGVSSRVYRAIDRETQSQVAIKILNRHLRTDAISIERFRREVQITRHLGHPQIIAIYDLVVEERVQYLAMEYLDGKTLKEHIAIHGALSCESALDILKQLLGVLAACHSEDVVHRDLKPQNIMIDAKGQIVLLDFGISRMTSLQDLTQTGTSLGSPEYMAPELFAATTFDPRTDLYAVGVLAYEMLAGRLPFQGDSLAMLYQQHREAEAPALCELRDDVPEWLAAIVAKLMSKQPFIRYQSADEALVDLGARRVVAQSLPQLEKRSCVHCDAETPAELPLCTECGERPQASFERGAADVRSRADEDPAALRAFFCDDLGFEAPKRDPKHTLLLSRIPVETAELIKTKAAQSRLFLDVEKSPRFSTPVVVCFIFASNFVIYWGLLPFALSAGVGWFTETLRQAVDSNTGPLVYVVTLQFFAGLGALWSYARGPMQIIRGLKRLRPWLKAPREALRPLDRLRWTDATAKRISAIPSAGIRAQLIRTVERLLLLEKNDPEKHAPVCEQLQDLADRAVELGAVGAQIEAALGGPAAQAALVRECGPEHGAVRVMSELRESYDSLANTLTRIQAAFNTAVGAVLALDAEVDGDGLRELETAVIGLKDELAVQDEVKLALESLS